MSTLMFWNKQNGNSNQNGSENGSTGKNKKAWLHTPESLVNGHVAYLVKVSGKTKKKNTERERITTQLNFYGFIKLAVVSLVFI